MFISRGIIKLSIIYHPQDLEFWAGTLTRALTISSLAALTSASSGVYGVVLTTLEFPVWT
jgi:hypothetical protein